MYLNPVRLYLQSAHLWLGTHVALRWGQPNRVIHSPERPATGPPNGQSRICSARYCGTTCQYVPHRPVLLLVSGHERRGLDRGRITDRAESPAETLGLQRETAAPVGWGPRAEIKSAFVIGGIIILVSIYPLLFLPLGTTVFVHRLRPALVLCGQAALGDLTPDGQGSLCDA